MLRPRRRLPGLQPLLSKLFPTTFRAYWPLWFLGKYSQGKAHIDLGPSTFNCYYLQSARRPARSDVRMRTRVLSGPMR